MVAAKKRAAELRKPVRDLVEAGLREQLRPKPAPRTKKIAWVTAPGALRVDVGDRAAMWSALDKA